MSKRAKKQGTIMRRYSYAVEQPLNNQLIRVEGFLFVCTSACMIYVRVQPSMATSMWLQFSNVLSTQQPTTRVESQTLASERRAAKEAILAWPHMLGVRNAAGQPKGLTRMTSLCKLTPSSAQIRELDCTHACAPGVELSLLEL